MYEDITDIITNISPDDTPMLTKFGNKTAKSTTVTSLTDSLPVPDSTPIVEGADVTTNPVNARGKVDNYVQIFDAPFWLSDTQIATLKHGVNDEVAYQIDIHSQKLALSMEKAIVTHDAANIGADGVAPKMGGIPFFNTVNNTVSSVFSETKFNDACAAAWEKGGKPSLALLAMKNKRIANTFNAGANKNRDQGDKKVIGPVKFYESDAGVVEWMPHRLISTARVDILDPQYFKMRFLIPAHMEPLAKTGHKDNYLITAQTTLECRSKDAQACVTGIS
jgi:hypothetical protein